MEYIPISFVAGVLTVLAPCVFTLLPVILGGSLTGKGWRKPATIIAALSISIFLFTLVLKASTLLIDIHPNFWRYLSGGILMGFGLITFLPNLWGEINVRLGLSTNSDKLLQNASEKGNFLGDVLIGAALGPVFSSCSPTYALIIATILPQEPLIGIANLIVYILGLAIVLASVSVFGQAFISKAKWAVNPNGIFKRMLGVLFIALGIFVFTGFDKELETYLLDIGLFDGITQVERQLIER